ncbi:related to integral membrane protein [Phialocephala subalpina]|uniref:Related to integral membrane protein n=1 Tax=Phialocephala subalpina TaxID=576137 RepID=A0A1L7XSC9_9HELO|nr:related to integral membrane protein [Phialocephala subalpina]
MADPISKDEAAKARIIKHMNADHADSLSLYLQHYCHLSARSTRNAQISSISLAHMSLQTTDGKAYSIPFSPPMTSWAEARTRTVDMDREARTALDVSNIKITSYEPPRKPFHIFVFGICLFTFGVFAMRNRIVPGTWFYDVPLKYWPGGPEWFVWIAKTIALPVVVIHLGEAYLMDRTRLRKHGVERGTALWWKWVVSCFIEGYGCHQRIDAAVRRKTKEAEAAKH